ncbi:hypothetical protein Bbelb_127080 [Branchiostoma belcheri]|nr:hypothetical protein Bbelb_127080 [Branchiostoma belcheri]
MRKETAKTRFIFHTPNRPLSAATALPTALKPARSARPYRADSLVNGNLQQAHCHAVILLSPGIATEQTKVRVLRWEHHLGAGVADRTLTSDPLTKPLLSIHAIRHVGGNICRWSPAVFAGSERRVRRQISFISPVCEEAHPPRNQLLRLSMKREIGAGSEEDSAVGGPGSVCSRSVNLGCRELKLPDRRQRVATSRPSYRPIMGAEQYVTPSRSKGTHVTEQTGFPFYRIGPSSWKLDWLTIYITKRKRPAVIPGLPASLMKPIIQTLQQKPASLLALFLVGMLLCDAFPRKYISTEHSVRSKGGGRGHDIWFSRAV